MQYCNKTWCINGAAALLGTIALLGLGVFLFITGAMAFDAAGPVGRFNLLVVLCGESRATPVVNTGSLYT